MGPGMLLRLRALIIASAVIMLLFWAIALPCVASFEYAEGDTATWIYLLRHGATLYATPAGLPMLSSNYPPLHLHILAWLSPSDGAILQTGRVVSLLAMLGCMAAIFVNLQRTCGSRVPALLGAVLFAATFRVGTAAAVCRADLPALCLGLWAATLAGLRFRGWPILSAVLFALSVFMKHSLVVIPVGVSLWALVFDRRSALCFVPLLGALVLAGLWKLELFGPLVTWSRAPWRPIILGTGLLYYFAPSLAGAVLAVWTVRRSQSLPVDIQPLVKLWSVIFLIGLFWLLALGRTGATANHLLEMLSAMVILIITASQRGLFSALQERLLALHVFATFCETLIGVAVLCGWLIPAAKSEQTAAQQAIVGIDGPLLVEEPWMTTSVGRPPMVIPFLSKQLGAAGLWDERPLVDAVSSGRIARVLVKFPIEEPLSGSWHEDHFSPTVIASLRERYVRVQQVGDLYVYKPRERHALACR